MEFEFLGQKISISDGRKNFMEIVTYFRGMAEQAERDFRQEYDSTLGTIFFNSNYGERFNKTYGSDDYMDGIVMRYVAKTRQFLSGYGVYDLSDSTIWKEGVLSEDRSVSRLQYEFNTFIVECLKLGEDDNAFITRIQSKFNGNFFPTCLYNDVMGLCDFVLNYLNDHNIASIQFVYKQDAEKARAIFSNLKDTVMTDEQKVAIMADIPMGLTSEGFAEEFQKRAGPQIPKKEKERLAFMLIDLDPRNKAYYDFIFENLPHAQYEIAAIAKYLNIDMSELIQKEILRSCNLKAINCEEDALKMMAGLRETMEKFGVTKSVRLEELEKILHDYDIKARTYDGILYATRELRAQAEQDDTALFELYRDLPNADKKSCKGYFDEIARKEVLSEIKEKYLQRVSARIDEIDREYLTQLTAEVGTLAEKECEQVRETINQYDATDSIKAPYLERIVQRIHDIWEMEDFAQFTEIYCQTRVSDSEQVGKNCVLIRETGRTETKELFIKALYLLNENEVAAAAKYANAKESGLFASIINMGKKEAYEILTLNGRVMHPAVLSAMEEAKAQKGKGLLSGLGFGRNKNKPTPAPTAASGGAKFCSACGAKTEGNAKFCANCGNKIG